MDTTNLPAFAATVKHIMASLAEFVPGSMWHGKMWICSVRDQMEMPRAQFDAMLIAAHRASLLRLSRADLVEAMPYPMVRESEVSYLSATFHFIRIDK